MGRVTGKPNLFSVHQDSLTSFDSKLLPLAGNSLLRFYENHKEFPVLRAESDVLNPSADPLTRRDINKGHVNRLLRKYPLVVLNTACNCTNCEIFK